MAQLSGDAFAFGGELMRVEQALALIARNVPAVSETERVSLSEADGRVMAAGVAAPIDLPLFDNSAVDGYAVTYADLAPDAETCLPIVGRVAAGDSGAQVGARGTAVRILTGAQMPPGTDTVFMQEDVRLVAPAHVGLPHGLKQGANRRPRGEDIAAGTEAFAAGRRLEPRDIALAAALGMTELTVRRRPRVAVFSTGNEIHNPGTVLSGAAIYDSNRFALTALLRRSGCVVSDLGILRDNRPLIEAALQDAAADHDLVVTSGGVSAGEEDHVRAAIAGRGSLVFWRLAIKPGRPVAMGIVNGTPLIGLPGNPVAVFVTYAHVLRPLIALISGATPRPLLATLVTADFAYRKKAGRREYVRVSLSKRGLETIATKYPVDGAGVITSLTRTDGLVELGEDITEIAAGDTVAFIDYTQMI